MLLRCVALALLMGLYVKLTFLSQQQLESDCTSFMFSVCYWQVMGPECGMACSSQNVHVAYLHDNVHWTFLSQAFCWHISHEPLLDFGYNAS